MRLVEVGSAEQLEDLLEKTASGSWRSRPRQALFHLYGEAYDEDAGEKGLRSRKRGRRLADRIWKAPVTQAEGAVGDAESLRHERLAGIRATSRPRARAVVRTPNP